ncbi:hypothetical protein [Pseudomonas sp. P8_241]|uniref:hypothetical protein n=1 Tax=Pseudomonas sp. P8_241 TaxID=3043445 RepID=UPI002A36DE7A|nr:hypothetical protein [Pseudomonas sp. P8_241]WPN49163.1 hypothetical protein QMK58_11060 [Pseudomonas sp. P8_241]
MTDQKKLIDWIHRVEFDPKKLLDNKRLPSIVTEIYFENYLSKRNELECSEELSFGWAYVKQKKGSLDRFWFKISDGNAIDKISCAFIKAVQKGNRRDIFFSVIPQVSLCEDIPDIAWKVYEITIQANGGVGYFYNEMAKNYQRMLNKNVRSALFKLRVCDASEGWDISGWLANESTERLKRLFSMRCMMNFFGIYLSDLDAVGINKEGRVEVLEFKRKSPTQGVRYEALPNAMNVVGLDLYLSRIIYFKTMKLSFAKEFADRLRWVEHTDVPGFGLDVSHANNVELCNRIDVDYRYIVWKSATREPTGLLSFEWVPLVKLDVRVLNVSTKDFDGLTSTKGGDSGTYTDRTRFQVVIPVSSFTKFQMP